MTGGCGEGGAHRYVTRHDVTNNHLRDGLFISVAEIGNNGSARRFLPDNRFYKLSPTEGSKIR